MDIVRIGFIGAGSWANEVHYPSLAEFTDVQIAAVCDLDRQKLDQTAAKYRIEKRFTDYREMLDQVELDAVYVVMPPQQLFDPIVDCLKRKLNLFTEKPPGVSAEQTRSFARLAEQNDCQTMVGFNRRFMPALVQAKRIVEQHGEISHCAASYYKHYLVDAPYYDGPATMLKIDGIHAVDTLKWLGGTVESVDSHVGHWHSGYPNSFRALVRFDRGRTGFLSADWSAGRRIQTVEIHSRGISAFIDVDKAAVIYADDSEEPQVIDVKETGGSDFRVYYGFRDENRHFIDCLKTGVIPQSSFSTAAKTMELVEAIELGGS